MTAFCPSVVPALPLHAGVLCRTMLTSTGQQKEMHEPGGLHAGHHRVSWRARRWTHAEFPHKQNKQQEVRLAPGDE